jgi:hypothetical protein
MLICDFHTSCETSCMLLLNQYALRNRATNSSGSRMGPLSFSIISPTTKLISLMLGKILVSDLCLSNAERVAKRTPTTNNDAHNRHTKRALSTSDCGNMVQMTVVASRPRRGHASEVAQGIRERNSRSHSSLAWVRHVVSKQASPCPGSSMLYCFRGLRIMRLVTTWSGPVFGVG